MKASAVLRRVCTRCSALKSLRKGISARPFLQLVEKMRFGPKKQDATTRCKSTADSLTLLVFFVIEEEKKEEWHSTNTSYSDREKKIIQRVWT